MSTQNMRECGRCHRVGYRGFVPVGDYGWACANDRACTRRTQRQVTATDWERMAHRLAARAKNWARCDNHPRSADPGCPRCDDRQVYWEYLELCSRAGLRPRQDPLAAMVAAAKPVPIEELAETRNA